MKGRLESLICLPFASTTTIRSLTYSVQRATLDLSCSMFIVMAHGFEWVQDVLCQHHPYCLEILEGSFSLWISCVLAMAAAALTQRLIPVVSGLLGRAGQVGHDRNKVDRPEM